MPGVFGIVSSNGNHPPLDSSAMLSELSYARAVVQECYREDDIRMGCAHVGTGGQRALYQSAKAAVLFFGYLTHPTVPPGADDFEPAAAARLIHDAYLSKGTALMHEISGAFCFALWDVQARALILANDRLGLRPLYYAEHRGIFRFASEVKGILADPAFPHRLDQEAVADLFQNNFVMAGRTLFEDIRLLPAASLLRFKDGRFTVSRYWEIPFPTHYPRRADRYYDDLIFEALRSAVRRMIRPGIRYGLSLSGGLDSRWIAALLAEEGADSLAFTLDSPGSDDTPPAKAVAAAIGMKHQLWEICPTLAAEWGEAYSYTTDGMDSLWHMEEFPITLRVGDYADVSVGGFLGDGLFGYEINPRTANLRRKDAAYYRRWRIRAGQLSKSQMARVFKDGLGKQFTAMADESLKRAYAESPSAHGFHAIQYYDLRQAEPRYANIAQLAKLPFVGIYHPIADGEVVLAALQLPPAQLLFERAYRRAMATHLPEMAAIPWTFTLTLPTISVPGIMLKKAVQLTLGSYLSNTPLGKHPAIRQRRYYAHHTEWSRGPLLPFVEKTLLSPETEALQLFDMDGLREQIRAHADGSGIVTGFIGAALALSLWARLFYFSSTPLRPGRLQPAEWERLPA